jgi:hypothetical protein
MHIQAQSTGPETAMAGVLQTAARLQELHSSRRSWTCYEFTAPFAGQLQVLQSSLAKENRQ